MFNSIIKLDVCKNCQKILALPINLKEDKQDEFAWTPDRKLVRLSDGSVVGCELCLKDFIEKYKEWERYHTWYPEKEEITFDSENRKRNSLKINSSKKENNIFEKLKSLIPTNLRKRSQGGLTRRN